MRSYLELVPQYAKVHKKNRTTILCIVIAVCLVTIWTSRHGYTMSKVQFIKDDEILHIVLKILMKKLYQK